MAFQRSSNSADGLQAAFDSGTPAQKATFQASVSGALSTKLSSKLDTFWRACYAGMTAVGGTPSFAAPLVKVAVFGDSVGNSKPMFLRPRLKAMLGDAGGLLTAWNLTGGATTSSNVNSGQYWINGAWTTVPNGGSCEFLTAVGGGRGQATKIKLYYITEPGAGAFRLQSNSGSGYADEQGYTSVSADGTLGAGIITLTKSSGSTWSLKVTGLTGTVRFLFGAHIQETTAGAFIADFSTGGLPLATAQQTPSAIKTAVFADMGFDLAFAEWKDNAEFDAAFADWTTWYDTAIEKKTSWVYIGTSPELIETTGGSWNTHNNATQAAYCASKSNCLYYDGYTPLAPYSRLVALGWNGDGTHLAPQANAYVASLMWHDLGFDDLMMVPSSRRISTDLINLSDGQITFSKDGAKYAAIGRPGYNNDLFFATSRSFAFSNLTYSSIRAQIAGGGENSTFTELALGTPFSGGIPKFTRDGSGYGLMVSDKDSLAAVKYQFRIPATVQTPDVSSAMTFEKASDTSLVIRVKGADGVVRSATLTLA